jgi:hypothetical protein
MDGSMNVPPSFRCRSDLTKDRRDGPAAPPGAVFLLVMTEDSDATCTFDVKWCRVANAVVRRSARRNGRSNLHDGKNVIVLG